MRSLHKFLPSKQTLSLNGLALAAPLQSFHSSGFVLKPTGAKSAQNPTASDVFIDKETNKAEKISRAMSFYLDKVGKQG